MKAFSLCVASDPHTAQIVNQAGYLTEGRSAGFERVQVGPPVSLIPHFDGHQIGLSLSDMTPRAYVRACLEIKDLLREMLPRTGGASTVYANMVADLGQRESALTYLPLAHVLRQVLDEAGYQPLISAFLLLPERHDAALYAQLRQLRRVTLPPVDERLGNPLVYLPEGELITNRLFDLTFIYEARHYPLELVLALYAESGIAAQVREVSVNWANISNQLNERRNRQKLPLTPFVGALRAMSFGVPIHEKRSVAQQKAITALRERILHATPSANYADDWLRGCGIYPVQTLPDWPKMEPQNGGAWHNLLAQYATWLADDERERLDLPNHTGWIRDNLPDLSDTAASLWEQLADINAILGRWFAPLFPTADTKQGVYVDGLTEIRKGWRERFDKALRHLLEASLTRHGLGGTIDTLNLLEQTLTKIGVTIEKGHPSSAQNPEAFIRYAYQDTRGTRLRPNSARAEFLSKLHNLSEALQIYACQLALIDLLKDCRKSIDAAKGALLGLESNFQDVKFPQEQTVPAAPPYRMWLTLPLEKRFNLSMSIIWTVHHHRESDNDNPVYDIRFELAEQEPDDIYSDDGYNALSILHEHFTPVEAALKLRAAYEPVYNADWVMPTEQSHAGTLAAFLAYHDPKKRRNFIRELLERCAYQGRTPLEIQTQNPHWLHLVTVNGLQPLDGLNAYQTAQRAYHEYRVASGGTVHADWYQLDVETQAAHYEAALDLPPDKELPPRLALLVGNREGLRRFARAEAYGLLSKKEVGQTAVYGIALLLDDVLHWLSLKADWLDAISNFLAGKCIGRGENAKIAGTSLDLRRVDLACDQIREQNGADFTPQNRKIQVLLRSAPLRNKRLLRPRAFEVDVWERYNQVLRSRIATTAEKDFHTFWECVQVMIRAEIDHLAQDIAEHL